MGNFLGIDTSNYRTSIAICDENGKITESIRELLHVGNGERGLRQSDALFAHTVALPKILQQMNCLDNLLAVGFSATPRDCENSYMPCFLAGKLAAFSISESNKIPCYAFSHQAGHIEAAAYCCGAEFSAYSRFLAFHVSGGTTESVLYDCGKITLLGKTNDLNAGQAVDRVGIALGLKFPCGEELEKLAQGVPKTKGIKISVKGYDCNLSGLENLALNMLKSGSDKQTVAAFTLDFISKTISAMTESLLGDYPGLPVLYSGGVMSCKRIQEQLKRKDSNTYFASPEYSGDNACGTALLCKKKYMSEFPT